MDLNLQVIDYLAKKGYSRTEAMLRMESANQEIDGRPLPPLNESRANYGGAFGMSSQMRGTGQIDILTSFVR